MASAGWQAQHGWFDYGRDIDYHFMHTFAECRSAKLADRSQYGFRQHSIRTDANGPKNDRYPDKQVKHVKKSVQRT